MTNIGSAPNTETDVLFINGASRWFGIARNTRGFNALGRMITNSLLVNFDAVRECWVGAGWGRGARCWEHELAKTAAACLCPLIPSHAVGSVPDGPVTLRGATTGRQH